jgi:hypothetical protein
MNGDLQVAGVRSRPTSQRIAWSERIVALRQKRERARVERLEVLERMSRHARQSRKAGHYVSGRGHGRRWA